MYINGINIEEYKAKLLESPSIAESDIDLSYLKAAGGSAITLFNQEYGVKTLNFTLEIVGGTRNEAYVLKSNLLKELQGICDIILTDGFVYRSILSGVSGTNVITSNIIQLELEFVCMQCGLLETVTLAASGIIENPGTMTSDCSICFTAGTDITDFWFQLNDMVVYIDQLTAGTKFLVDGLNKTVKNDSDYAVNETDLKDFPKLSAGINELTLSNDVSVTIEFYPVYM